MNAREQKLVNWIDAAQQDELRSMEAAMNAGDAFRHALQGAAFDALVAVRSKMAELVRADYEAGAPQ